MDIFEVDLHLHSLYSDGSFTPEEILRRAKEKGIRAVALTDHDCIDGVEEFVRKANKFELEAVTGIEITSTFDGSDVHILGYGFNLNEVGKINRSLKPIQETFKNRSKDVLDKYKELGIMDVSVEDIIQEIGVNVSALSLMHIANFRANIDPNISLKEAKDELWRGGSCWIEFDDYPIISPTEAVTLIRDFGGVPVLAHPGEFFSRTKKEKAPSVREFLRLIDQLKTSGLVGIEVNHPAHSREFTASIGSFAKEQGFLITGGSDFHGIFKSVDIGDGGIDLEDLSRLKNILF